MYRFIEMNADGSEKGKCSYHGLEELRFKISLLCPHMPFANREHFIALANAAPGHPVDVTHWEGEHEESRRMVYAARIWVGARVEVTMSPHSQ